MTVVEGVADLVARRALRAVFQPIVDLDSGHVVAYEALTRGPQGSPLERPDVLFEQARAQGLHVELDRACRDMALATAHAAGVRERRLFVNAEPDALGTLPSAAEHEALPVTLELTERELTSRPAEMLRAVATARDRGWGIALDDVGADPASLALLPLISPDVIKLDLRLVQARPDPEVAAVMSALTAHAERTGALLLAEGIETHAHVLVARSLGATLGQGWHFGRPAPLPADAALPSSSPLDLPFLGGDRMHERRTPFRAVTEHRAQRSGTKRLLLEICTHLESKAAAGGRSAIVLSTFQHERNLTPATAALYEHLARVSALVGAFGVGVDDLSVAGVRGGTLAPGDPLALEWDVVVLTPDYAAALVALDRLDADVADLDRRFDFVLTHDRELVVQAARGLVAHLSPRDPRAL